MARARLRSVLLWALFVATLIVLVIMVVVTIVDEVDPSGSGTPGTAVVTHCTGQGTNQQCYGDYRSADGATVLRDTRIWGEDFGNIGQTFTVYYDASTRTVDAVTSGEDLSTSLIVIGWLLVLALVQFWFRIMLPLRRRRALVSRAALDELIHRHGSD